MTDKNKTDWFAVGSNIFDAASLYGRAVSTKGKATFEAQQNLQNERRSLRAGERNAMAFREQGRQTASEALVAMVSQGATVDDSVLAKIKKQADLNAIGAMYDAKADALTSKYAALSTQAQGRREYRANMLGAASNIMRGAAKIKWD